MPERPPPKLAPQPWTPARTAAAPTPLRPTARPPAARLAPPAPAAASSMTWLARQPRPATPAAPAAPGTPERALAQPAARRALPARPPTATAAPSATGVSAAAAAASTAWQLVGRPGDALVLMPGQMHVGQQVASLRTLLGSCVAITLWHPGRRIGGMCHYLLPQRNRRANEPLDGRYGDEAVEAMVKCLQGLRADPRECVAHLYGGADTLSGQGAGSFNIGERNIEQGWSLIDRYGFALDGVDVGEDVPRTVTLTLATGQVDMRRGAGTAAQPARDDAAARPGAVGSSARFF